jgi:hypothetical protein
MTDSKKYFIGIDLGTGSGAKVGLFKDHDHQIAETLLPRSRYGQTPESLTDALTQSVFHLLKKYNKTFADLHAVGIATPGLLASDFSYVLASNLPFLNGFNLADAIESSIGAPVSIENDANAGALAEWSVARTEILYWVFGGGWGGAWVSADGDIRFPAVDWNGDDASLHYTSEPGTPRRSAKKSPALSSPTQEGSGPFLQHSAPRYDCGRTASGTFGQYGKPARRNGTLGAGTPSHVSCPHPQRSHLPDAPDTAGT